LQNKSRYLINPIKAATVRFYFIILTRKGKIYIIKYFKN